MMVPYSAFGLGHTKRRLDDGTDDGTVSDGRRAAVMCPVVVLYGKLASKNARRHGDHVVSCTSIKVVQNDVFVTEFKSNFYVSVSSAHTLPCYTQDSPVPSSKQTMSRRLIVSPSWSDYCTTAH